MCFSADLIAGAAGNKPGDMDSMGRPVRRMGSDDDQVDNAPFQPPMQPNAPFSSAQSHLSNSQAIANQLNRGVPVLGGADTADHGFPLNKPSLGTPSSLSSMTNSSINPASLQQKLHQQQQFTRSQGAPARTVQSVQQQLIQQQIVQQLQMAVQAGLISPQLLNQQLTPTMLVMLQQLLQLQQVLQRLVAQQSVIQQNRTINNSTRVHQLDQIHITIQRIKQQIVQQQQQIAQAQAALGMGKQVAPPPATTPAQAPGSDPAKELLKELPTDMNNLQIKDNQTNASSAGGGGQSRLVDWIRAPPPEKDQSMLMGDGGLNKAPGSKPSSSSGLPFSDHTWSNSSGTASWPTNTSTTTSSVIMDKNDPMAHPGAPNSSSSSSSSSGAGLDIEEFVPGKPWTGAATKSVEDDPFLTPGTARQGSLSLKDDYVSAGSNPGGSETSQPLTSSWNSLTKNASATNLSKTNWSSSTSLTSDPASSSLASELWGVPSVPKPNRPPPGLGNQNKSLYQAQPGFNRSTSWAPERTTMTPGKCTTTL